MSINVTVNGNPVSIRRGRMVLSDLDQIKKNERDRRKRLRLEQVRQQSKEISNRLLERAKNVTNEQLTRLEKDGKSELKQMHDRKIMELQRKYQEDMEDIGHAHAVAALEPNLDAAIEVERKKNRALAVERGKEAMQRMKEMPKVDDPHVEQQERLKQVRELENARSAMIANLPKKSSPKKRSDDGWESAEEDIEIENVGRTSNDKNPKKKKHLKSEIKKSSGKETKKSPEKTAAKSSPVKLNTVNQKKVSVSPEPQPGPSGLQKQKWPVEDLELGPAVTSKAVTDISQLPRTVPAFESDEQEPRKIVPTLNTSPTKADKMARIGRYLGIRCASSRYNPQDYKQSTSVSSSSSSSSLSDDSSYFSDGDQYKSKKTPKHHTSLAGSKVQVYDYSTRQRNAYDRPAGIVEKVDILYEPNAEDIAREVAETESVQSRAVESHRLNAERRGNDAILRERVRRDYQTLLKNLDHLSREERKLRASQIHGPPKEEVHTGQARRKESQEKRQKAMDRKFEDILHDSSATRSRAADCLVDRAVTIPPRDNREDANDSPRAIWQNPPFFDGPATPEGRTSPRNQENEEVSREEQILEMLKKVERQKRLLLREFGADLPSNVFSATMRPLFDSAPPEVPREQRPESVRPVHSQQPEIKVINMSSSDDSVAKKNPPRKEEPSKSQRIEIAVQTSRLDETGAARDKGVQVQLIKAQSSVVGTSTNGEDIDDEVQEKKVKQVVVPCTAESSSGSSGSVVTGVIIDIHKKQVKVTPTKKSKGTLKVSKRTSPRFVSKPKSVPSSKVASPVKRSLKSAPASRIGSPKKSTSSVEQTIVTSDKKVNIRLEKGDVKVKVDSSTESSQAYLTPDFQQPSTSRGYRSRSQSVFRRVVKTRDTSDTSTSYMSPPPATPGSSVLRALNGSTPILEMLDSSACEETRLSRQEVSPVSSPETPSPRTIMMPTNVFYPGRIHKILRLPSSYNSQANHNIAASSTPNNSTETDRSGDYSKKSKKSSQRPTSKPREICSCRNPGCKLLHDALKGVEGNALKNSPEIMKKYDDLQNICTEKIASLNDLIERVRNEQKGMDFSVVAPSDESSLLPIPGLRPMESNDLCNVRKLVESIEAIHNQLAKTLVESQKIIAEGDMPEQQTTFEAQTQAEVSRDTSEKSKESISTNAEAPADVIQAPSSRAKSRIVSNELVNIPEDLLRELTKPPSIVKTEGSVRPVSRSPEQHEDMVKQLSNEILEQSKNVDKALLGVSFNQESEESSIRQRTPSPVPLPKKSVSFPDKKDSSPVKEGSKSPKAEKEADFVPLLAGIPKVSRSLPTAPSTTTARAKPPVTLVSGPYRSEIGAPGHELSTIVEFDTPDTANRSQGSARSPPGKSKRNLITGYPSASVEPTRLTPDSDAILDSSPKKQSIYGQKQTDIQPPKASQTTIKPSVHVAPLPAQQSAHTPRQRSPPRETYSPTKMTTPTTTQRPPMRGGAPSSRKVTTSTENSAVSKDVSTESTDSLIAVQVERSNRSNARKQTPPFQSDPSPQPGPSKPTKFHIEKQERNDKITSTSSNSFSGLSGISEMTSTPSSDVPKYASSPEEMEATLKKLGLGWAITTLKKTREASALSSSSNSDITPMNTGRKMHSPVKKQPESDVAGLPDLSDVSSISIKDASKSTERAVLLKGRTSTPNIQNSNSSSGKSSTAMTSSSGTSLQDQSDSLTVPNISLTSKKACAKEE